jgi:hypothetical protein
MLKKDGHDFISGDIAIKAVRDGKLDPKDTYVIQEENARHGNKLISLGAVPFLLYSWESPLYASLFYDRLRWLAPKFQHRMLFNFAFDLFDGKEGKNHSMLFPSFDVSDILEPKLWSERKELAMIAANKSANRKWQENRNLKELIYHAYKKVSPAFRHSITHELHSERIKCLLYFQDRIDLYGALWDDLSNLSRETRDPLEPLIVRKKPQFCADKRATLSKYRFCICAENVDYPGYLTEKIFDCFATGVIPIYFGHGSVFNHVPKEAIIYWRDFESLKELDRYLSSISETKAMEMIECGQKFLRGEAGRRFSNEAFAKRVYSLANQSAKV